MCSNQTNVWIKMAASQTVHNYTSIYYVSICEGTEHVITVLFQLLLHS